MGAIVLATAMTRADAPRWVGRGKHRLLVRVEPRVLGARTDDEMPARIHINSTEIRTKGDKPDKAERIDVASIQIERYDPANGQPIRYGKWHYAQADWEIPYRWYDDSIPEEYPEVLGDVDSQTGAFQFCPMHNWGYLHETQGEWKSGNLAWIHAQHADAASYYAIYFDMLAAGKQPHRLPRVGFLGDGLERIEETAPTTHGEILSRVEVADWNGDALPDILVGGSRGSIIWYSNHGTKDRPSFSCSQLLFTADGKPLDVGFNATPLVLDWDGDGTSDLLCGAEWNRAVWYKNVGTNAEPRLTYRGLIHADGKPLGLPNEPVPEAKSIYERDYHPVLATADVNGDGNADLLAGGYITGQIYWFENQGRGADHLPILHFRGPLEADGAPLDVGWAAAPAVGDVDGDGLVDIVTGSMPMTSGGGDSVSSESYLILFTNTGTKTQPRFARQKFPMKGQFPVSSIAAPRLVDLNDDGLLDLVVARNADLSIYKNVGTKRAPLWEYASPLPGKWQTSSLYGWTIQLMDWNNDGHFDLVQGFSARLNLNQGNPQFFGDARNLTGPDERIFHKSPFGDQWTFTHVVDMDGDGQRDILYGVHEGWVYLHRNLGRGDALKFDTQGVRLNTQDGKPIKVGPRPGQKWDFDVLQGARTTFAAADFDRDGKMDLVVGDTYGVLRYYRNLTGGPNPAFAQPVVIADLHMRLVPSISDWDGDGWPDVLVGSNRAFTVMNTGKPDGPRFLTADLIVPPGVEKEKSQVLEQIAGSPEWRLAEVVDGPGIYLPYEELVNAADWNEDGDLDLLVLASYGYLCWYDRSFLEHGYAPGRLDRVETHGGS